MDKNNDAIQSMKQNIEVMNQVYKNFYAIYSGSFNDKMFWQQSVSCELFVEKEVIKYVLWVPKEYMETFEKMISSFYPGAVIDQIESPRYLDAGKFAAWGYFVNTKASEYPIKTYENFEVDPMDSVLAWFARVGADEMLWLQIIVSPLTEKWQSKMRKKINKVKEWWGWGFLSNMFGNSGGDDEQKHQQNHDLSQQQIGDIEKKWEDEWFNVVIRWFAVSPDKNRPVMMMTDLKRSLNQYNYIGLNSFMYLEDTRLEKFAKRFILRLFSRPYFTFKANVFRVKPRVLNIKELASIFHFPHSRFNRNPRIAWQKFKIVPAPDDLPKEGLLLWDNLYSGVKKQIKLWFDDRFRHFYIIGQTGTGKSTILQSMLRQDCNSWAWFTLIDPHGDLAERVVQFFPKDRIEDLIYWDAGNMDLPFGFNFLTARDEREMDLVTNDAVDMFVKLYGADIFWPRIQDYFRNAVLTLMEQPDGGTLIEIVRLFTDEAFQKIKVSNVKNPVVRSRWEKTYNSMGDKEKKEMIPYFQSKFGSFTTTPILRNIIGQPESSFDIGEIMDSWKCLVMNLSKGKMGDINADLLGMMIVSQIRLAAFRRANITEEERVPHFLYIDEFQNFVTPAIESILSEARKYKLGMVMAHQYLWQLEQWSWSAATNLKDPIFGNVWNMLAYRIWVDDTDAMEKQFSPNFSWTDLLNLDKFKAIVKLSVDMQPTPAFSLNVKLPWSFDPPILNPDEKVAIMKQISALKYGRKKELVDKEIFFRVGA